MVNQHIYIYQWDYVRSLAKNFIFAGYLGNLWDLEKGWSSPTLHVFLPEWEIYEAGKILSINDES